MPILRGSENLERFEIIERQIFRRAFDRRKATRPEKSGNCHALGKMFLFVPLVEVMLDRGIDIGHHQQQPLRYRHSFLPGLCPIAALTRASQGLMPVGACRLFSRG
jgi:hypothetical protein